MCTLLKSFRGTGAHQNAGEEFREREREFSNTNTNDNSTNNSSLCTPVLAPFSG